MSHSRSRFTRRSATHPRHGRRPSAEQLECRALLAGEIFTVNALEDPDDREDLVTFTEALIKAHENENPDDVDRIEFLIPGLGPHLVGSGRFQINQPVEIDGTTQPGYDVNNPMPMIILEGTHLSTFFSIPVVDIRAGRTTLRGLVIRDSQLIDQSGFLGVAMTGGGGNLLVGNFIGTDPTGTFSSVIPDSTHSHFGVLISGSSGNTIGGPSAADRNVISGMDTPPQDTFGGVGIVIEGSRNNLIQGNRIGTRDNGLDALPNDHGIVLLNASDNTIGGADPAGNVLSGNSRTQVILLGESQNNQIVGNRIGIDRFGVFPVVPLVDTDVIGVRILGAGATRNVIGGDTEEEANILSANDVGVSIENGAHENFVWGNLIGTDVLGTSQVANRFGVSIINASGNFIGGGTPELRNLISGNTSSGVEIQGAAAQANQVIGNFIGTNRTGTARLRDDASNLHGVLIAKEASNNFIGGIDDTSDSTFGLGNLISGNLDTGVKIQGLNTSRNQVLGNYIGTNRDGTARLDEDVSNEFGVAILDGASNNTVGGTLEGTRNIISGNIQSGVQLQDSGTTGNRVQGNYIGTDKLGTARLAGLLSNNFGVAIRRGASNNVIGGADADDGEADDVVRARNIISGNLEAGVLVRDAGTDGNRILGNYIGTDVSGTSRLADDSSNLFGIVIRGGATFNTIGGTADGARNVISGNHANGVHILDEMTEQNLVEGNYIGTNVEGDALLVGNKSNANGIAISAKASKNTIGGRAEEARNIISGNTGAGVQITDEGTDDNEVWGNYIGTDKEGKRRLAGDASNNDGVIIFSGASSNDIGGILSGMRNIISGNLRNGILIEGAEGTETTDNSIIGNFIGTDRFGDARLADGKSNQFGVAILGGATGNFVGGILEPFRNVISGNLETGVHLEGTGTTGNQVLGNYIGTDHLGTSRLRGDTSNRIGVTIIAGASNNTIGGAFEPERNVISGNLQAGVLIQGTENTETIDNRILGNYIGPNKDGTGALLNLASNKFGVVIRAGAVHNFLGGVTEAERNVVSGNIVAGVLITGEKTTQNIVVGNYIGPDKHGTRTIGAEGVDDSGVILEDGAHLNLIGVTGSDGARNVISGNRRFGVLIRAGANQNAVANNYIGLDASGTARLANGSGGVFINGNGNLVVANVISGNGSSGVTVQASFGNGILGNRIGTDKDGVPSLLPFPGVGLNNDQAGIALLSASGSVIGGAGDGEGNLISGNFQDGVFSLDSVSTTIQGNTISFNRNGINILTGLAVIIGRAGSASDPLEGNVITENRENGVNIEGSSNVIVRGCLISENDEVGLRCRRSNQVTWPDTAFTNNGVNVDCEAVMAIPAPVAIPRTAAQTNSTLVEAVLTGSPDTSYHVSFFAGPPPDSLGFSDPAALLGSLTVTTDAQGVAHIRTTFPADIALGQGITVNATGPDGNTSDFSSAIPVTPLPPRDELSVEDAAIIEGDGGPGLRTITIVRRNVSDDTVTVEVSTTDGTARVADGDYEPVTGQVVTFGPGVIQQTIQISVGGDLLIEPDESFGLTLSNPTGGAVIGRATGTATILTDDFNEVSISDASVTEGAAGTTTLEFTVSLAEPAGQPVTVEVHTSDGTATAASGDYAPLSGLVLTFDPGAPLSQTIVVTVHGDTTVEANETLSVMLSNATGPNAGLGDAMGTGTIENDDLLATFSIGDASVVESHSGVAQLQFVVTLSNPSDTPATVRVDSADGSATSADEDYEPLSGLVLTFLPGDPLSQTVTLTINGDTTVEPDETLSLVLSEATGLGIAIDDATGQGTIVNDDATTISIRDVQRREGTGATSAFEFLVSLSNPIAAPVTVTVDTADGTATSPGGDYTPVLGRILTFDPGGPLSQLVTIDVTADNTVEATETFTVHLSNATGPSVSILDDQALALIGNDDNSLIGIDDVALAEGHDGVTAFVFTVGMTNPSDRPLSVRVDTIDGSARAAAGDYTAITNLILTFDPGDPLAKALVVEVRGDLRTEPDKTFRVALSSVTGSTVLIIKPFGQGTIRDDDADSDSDGVSDALEDLGSSAGDSNQDGSPDRAQPTVASLPNAIDESQVTLVSPALATFSAVRAVSDPDPFRSPPDVAFPVGFFEYALALPSRGGRATVTFLLPQNVSPTTFYRHGRQSPTDPFARFSEFLFDGTTGAELLPDRVVVHLVDGGRGDHDLAVDGRITTSGAPGLLTGTDLALEIASSPDPVGQNRPLRYTLSVTNNGPNDATGVTLVDTIPTGAEFIAAAAGQGSFIVAGDTVTFHLGNLRVGATATATIDLHAPGDEGPATNTAAVRADQAERNPADNTAAITTVVRLIGLIEGQKFQDTNANGRRDPGEVGLNGFTIQLVDQSTGQVAMTTTTRPIDLDANGVIDPETERGRYEFEVLVGGTFEVREQDLPGFTQTFPTSSTGASITERVSVDSAGSQAAAASFRPAISADGRFVAFESAASNLVPGDTNNATDIFVFDRQTRTTERVSVPDPRVGQAEANDSSEEPAISADGRFVAYESQASNLVLGDNFIPDVYVYDRLTGTTQRMSEDANGVGGNAPSGDAVDFAILRGPSISADGRFVAFSSAASNLVPRTIFVRVEVFVKDRETGAIERVSVTNAGDLVQGSDSRDPSISADGRFVSFVSTADLTLDGGGGGLFVFDRQTDTVERIPVGTDFAPLSADGRFLAFSSNASDLVPDDTNGVPDVFVFDRQTTTTERVSVDASGGQATGGTASGAPSISSDGRYVAFVSDATNLVPVDTNNAADVFVHDRQTGAIERVSVDNAGGQAAGAGDSPFDYATALSADAQVAAFDSDAVNLVSNDTNAAHDVFVRATTPGGTQTHRVTVFPGASATGRDFGNAGVFTHDFGDAPESYDTRESDDGARHVATGPHLGTLVEPERDGQPGQNADGDDRDGIDDEDGVLFAGPLVRGETAEVVVSASSQALLDAWIDFDRDGVFDHPAEQVFASLALATGDNTLQFPVPSSAQPGATYARFRISSVGGLSPTGLAPDGEVEDHALTVLPFAASADLSITKSAGASTIAPGNRVTYTLIVTNQGPSDAHDVVLTDTLPQGVTVIEAVGWTEGPAGTLTFSRSTLLAGEAAQLTITIESDPSATGTLSNLVTVRSATPEANPGDEQAMVDVSVVPPADLVVSISDHQDPVVAGSNLLFTATDEDGHPVPLPLGPAIRSSLVIYTITVRNDGPSDAEDVVVTHALPLGLIPLVDIAARSLGTIRAGASMQYTIAGQVDSGVLGAMSAQVTARSTTPEAALSNNTASEDTTVIEHADLSITVADDVDPVNPGGSVTYTVTVSNRGPSDAHDVVVSNRGPAGATVFPLGTVPANRTKQFTVTVPVGSGATGTLSNVAIVRSSTVEANPGDEEAAENTLVSPSAARETATHLAVSPNPATAGQPVIVTAIVTAEGGGTPTGTVIFTIDGVPQPPSDITIVNDVARATITLATLGIGSHTITASYSGGPGFHSSMSGSVNLAIQSTGEDLAPFVASVRRFGFHHQPTRLVLTFSEDLVPTEVVRLGNYRLIAPGKDGMFGTADDRVIRLRRATYDPAERTVTLHPTHRLPLWKRFLLAVPNGKTTRLVDHAGNALDGDRDGRSGGTFKTFINRKSLAGRWRGTVAALHRGRGD